MESENRSIKTPLTTVINLFVIDKIFNEVAKIKLAPLTQILYINCLTKHFKDKEATFNNIAAFKIYKDDFKNIDKWEYQIMQLDKAGLITVDMNSIYFNNTWGKYIDRTLLEKVDNVYTPGIVSKIASGYKDDMINSAQLYELTVMKHKVTKVNYLKLIDLFVKEQDAFEKIYNNFADCARHFNYWILSNIDKIPKEIVKSNNKILGMNG